VEATMKHEPRLHQQVNLRKSHPGLFHSILTVGCMGIAMALNFLLYRPTFNPYGVDKSIIGLVFAAIGLGQLVFLIGVRDLRLVRIMLAISISWMMFWGLSNTLQFFAGNASLQLPIMFVVVSILQVPLLLESPVNPFTEKK
jgi:hypothetical protein